MSFLFALLLAADAAVSPTPEPIDAVAAGERLAAAFEKTTARVDGEITSEVVVGQYRIGLVLSAPKVIRPRSATGRFTEPSKPDADQTFIGAVVRDARTKRFLPEARVTAILEHDVGGGDTELRELAGPYPIYGDNLRLPPKGVRAITINIGPPAYDRHAEMLAAFTGEATARFELKDKASGKTTPRFDVLDPKKPGPHAEDWVPGNDLRQAAGEARGLIRLEEWLVGFIAEGPEPYWFWKGQDVTPEHCAVKTKDTHHLEAIAIHEPSGLMITSGTAILRFARPPQEHHDFLLRPLLAEFFHYGGNFEVPPGTWSVMVLVDPPRHDVLGEGRPYVPERRLIATTEFVREADPGAALSPQDEAKAFANRLTVAAQKYGEGEQAAAQEEVTEAFFDFEGSRLDARLRAADPSGYKALEGEWIGLRAKMKSGGTPMEVGVAADRIGRALVAYSANLDEGPSGEGAFLRSLGIFVREGVEAILVLGLVIAVLRKTKRESSVRLVWVGAALALAASVVLGVAFVSVVKQARAALEGIEGLVNLAAMLILFFTSFWLISRVEGRRWAEFIKHQIEGVAGGGRAAIVSLAFLVVFREGAETVLMFTPDVMAGAIVQVLLGVAVATVILALIFYFWIVVGVKFPIRPFFGISGALLYLLAFKFAGDGISELQAAGWMPFTEVSWIPKSRFLQNWLGVRPSIESCALQGLLVLAVIIGLAVTFFRRPAPAVAAG